MFSNRKLLVVLLVLLFQLRGASFAWQAKSESESNHLPQLEAFIKKQAADDKFSGVVLIAQSGKAVLSAAYGSANKKTNTPIRINTKFDLGSMPKMFTAIAVAQLAEAGKLHYDDPIIKYLPSYPDKAVAQKVTIHQLLTHTAGFGNYFRPGFFEKRFSTVKEYLTWVQEDPLEGDSEGKYAYSNSGYVVLGAIVEKASGQDFYDYVRDHIFRPAGMEDTGYYTREEQIENAATGYTRGQGLMILRPGNPSPAGKMNPALAPSKQADSGSAQTGTGSGPLKDTSDMRPYRGSPAGGAYSSAPDLLKFVEALESYKLVNAHSLDLLQAGKVDTRPGGPRYGYGFIEWKFAGHRIVGHGGGAPGVNTMLQIYPDTGYCVIVLSNYDPPAAEDIAAKAREELLGAAAEGTSH